MSSQSAHLEMYLNYRKTLFDQTQDGRPESQNQIYNLK